ncbi:hypothetical protein HMPREF1548_00089 [Clostridium sp. KLE 1755]|nr:hypothetical protein HMPREF1548_00089 [Clostridium sp. KLE 1755]
MLRTPTLTTDFHSKKRDGTQVGQPLFPPDWIPPQIIDCHLLRIAR